MGLIFLLGRAASSSDFQVKCHWCKQVLKDRSSAWKSTIKEMVGTSTVSDVYFCTKDHGEKATKTEQQTCATVHRGINRCYVPTGQQRNGQVLRDLVKRLVVHMESQYMLAYNYSVQLKWLRELIVMGPKK